MELWILWRLMNNTYDLIAKAKELDQNYYHAVGQITMANLLQRTTDLWGDVHTYGLKGMTVRMLHSTHRNPYINKYLIC